MIGRIRGRATFAHLVAHGRRIRTGVLWCTFLLDPSVSPPEVAFAVTRAVGTAVTRNQVRRRLRELVRNLAPSLPAGRYLIGTSPRAAGLSSAELAFALNGLVSAVRAQAGVRAHTAGCNS